MWSRLIIKIELIQKALFCTCVYMLHKNPCKTLCSFLSFNNSFGRSLALTSQVKTFKFFFFTFFFHICVRWPNIPLKFQHHTEISSKTVTLFYWILTERSVVYYEWNNSIWPQKWRVFHKISLRERVAMFFFRGWLK